MLDSISRRLGEEDMGIFSTELQSLRTLVEAIPTNCPVCSGGGGMAVTLATDGSNISIPDWAGYIEVTALGGGGGGAGNRQSGTSGWLEKHCESG